MRVKRHAVLLFNSAFANSSGVILHSLVERLDCFADFILVSFRGGRFYLWDCAVGDPQGQGQAAGGFEGGEGGFQGSTRKRYGLDVCGHLEFIYSLSVGGVQTDTEGAGIFEFHGERMHQKVNFVIKKCLRVSLALLTMLTHERRTEQNKQPDNREPAR